MTPDQPLQYFGSKAELATQGDLKADKPANRKP